MQKIQLIPQTAQEESRTSASIAKKEYTLEVEEISQDRYPDAIRIAFLWEKAAQEKGNRAQFPGEKIRFFDCETVCRQISQRASSVTPVQKIYICKDEESPKG